METTLTIGRRGDIVLPAEFRDAYGLKENDRLVVETSDNGLLLRPASGAPDEVEIYTEERIAEFAQDEDEVARRLAAKGL